MKTPVSRPDLEHVVNYTIVALVGMMAGFLLGRVFRLGHGDSGGPATAPVVAHPRALDGSKP